MEASKVLKHIYSFLRYYLLKQDNSKCFWITLRSFRIFVLYTYSIIRHVSKWMPFKVTNDNDTQMPDDRNFELIVVFWNPSNKFCNFNAVFHTVFKCCCFNLVTSKMATNQIKVVDVQSIDKFVSPTFSIFCVMQCFKMVSVSLVPNSGWWNCCPLIYK